MRFIVFFACFEIASEIFLDVITLRGSDPLFPNHDGRPLKDITAVRRVVFVMKGGTVFKNVARNAIPAYAGVQP